MKQTRTACDANAIRKFLLDELEVEEQDQLIVHLEECSTCRRQLENDTAQPDWWQDVSDFLSDDELDTELGATLDGSLIETDESRIPKGAISGVIDHLNASDDPHMMGRFGGYEIVGVIGCGGMGVVLKGFESALNRFVAIKVLAPHLAMSGAARARFSREGQAAASVVHPNVVAIHRVSEADGLPFLVMPYVGGESLQKRINDHGALPVTAIVRVALQVCRGLAAAHSQGLVHRDIKPANILLEQDVERVILTDFGLARAADDASMTNTGVLAGTPQYMSPEQARGERVDQRSDLFSLGSVLFTLCTGRPPFRSETSYGILRKITDTQPRPIREINPDIPLWLVRLIEKLHAKDPSDRFQTAGEVAELLEQCLAHTQQPDLQPVPAELADSYVQRNRHWLLPGTLAGAMILAVTMIASQQPWKTDTQTEQPSSISELRQHAATDSEAANTFAEPSAASVSELSDETWMQLETVFDDLQATKNEIENLELKLENELTPIDSLQPLTIEED